MVEKKGLGKAVGHAVLWFGIAIVLFPLYIALVATTHTFDVLIGSTPLWFGGEFLKNFTTVLTQGLKAAGGIPVWVMMANSLVMALGIAIGKIAISITAAYAIVYFRFPGRELCFVLIFITLMMPVEVRIVPRSRWRRTSTSSTATSALSCRSSPRRRRPSCTARCS